MPIPKKANLILKLKYTKKKATSPKRIRALRIRLSQSSELTDNKSLLKNISTQKMSSNILTPPASQITPNPVEISIAEDPIVPHAQAETKQLPQPENPLAQQASAQQQLSATPDSPPAPDDTSEVEEDDDAGDGDVTPNTDICDSCKASQQITITCFDCKSKFCAPCTKLDDMYFISYKCTKRRFTCISCIQKLIDEKPIYKSIQKELNKKHKPQNTENTAPPKPQRISAKSRTEPNKGDRAIPPDPVLSSPQLQTPKKDLSLAFQEVKSPNPNQDKTKSKTICKFYKRGVCVGARGSTKCEFAHPRACKWYLIYGPGGCQRGGKCRFLHPKLCCDSLNDYKCYNLECKFYHLKGTERYEKRDTRPDYSRVPGPKNFREISQEANRMDHLETSAVGRRIQSRACVVGRFTEAY